MQYLTEQLLKRHQVQDAYVFDDVNFDQEARTFKENVLESGALFLIVKRKRREQNDNNLIRDIDVHSLFIVYDSFLHLLRENNLTFLTSLVIQSAQLTSLLPEISRLTNLTALAIRFISPLSCLPAEIGLLTKLTRLMLRQINLMFCLQKSGD